ncbi:alpha-tubulin suppressor-like RCC1 family protein [Paenibacillus endophyticus]|uniref:Alpha-tubulin suppressor-like RCC1 family protein n=2 Tax=Paenibacillus endophyticus TaxID=1294268 RepID=A0A7W5CB61_9BACL|nr:S-layer homology domain-containing protein [Paenibacillus endophyticus]MBB3153544.1 alpha-tubulin suppressor-like RCC1 family protein [Paenibacillus endophyticus]
MLSLHSRKSVHLLLTFVLLLSLMVPYGSHIAYASQTGIRSVEGTQIAAGANHSLLLKPNGTVAGWGLNNAGQVSIPNSLTDVISIAAGSEHSLALKSDGTVVAWGNNTGGASTIPDDLTAGGVIAIAAGANSSLALKADGAVVAWGGNDAGQADVPVEALTGVIAIAAGKGFSVALKSNGNVVVWGGSSLMNVPLGLNNVVAIAAGTSHILVLKSDGTVDSWGSVNVNGQSTIPAELTGGGVLSIAAGGNNSLALKTDGTVVAWGNPNNGQTNVPAGLTNVASIAVGWNHTLVLKTDGTVVAWGANNYNQTTLPTSAALPIKGNSIAGGGYHSLALKSDGLVAGWGMSSVGQTTIPVGLTDVVSIAGGLYHSLALKSDGTVVGWGQNLYGQSSVPIGLNNVVSIAVGELHSLALKSNGTVVAWGSNADGQRSVPVGLNNVVSIAAGESHSIALKSDGTVVAWGHNYFGQISVPSGLTDVVSIAGGANHSLALKSDGTVVAWGSNVYDQSTVPAGLDGVVSIAAGASHSLALKSDGSVVSWGFGVFGQATVPNGLSRVKSIAAGKFHSLALKSDGTVVGWGASANRPDLVPGNADLSGLALQEGDFSEPFQASDTSYTYYYDGQSLSSVDVTPTLADLTGAALYVNNELLASGSSKTINIAGATTNTVIPVRVEPYLKASQTYTITLEIDSTSPEVVFGTNGQAIAAKTASSKVLLNDTQSGVDSDSLAYVWSQSTVVPFNGWMPFNDQDTISQTSGNGNWYLHIRATDKVGNAVAAVSGAFVLDNTAPTAAISSSAGSGVNGSFPVTIAFNESVDGFTVDDLEVTNGTASDLVAVSESTYTATISPATSGQHVTVFVEAGAATDVAGNESTASNTLNLMYDTTLLAVTFGNFAHNEQFVVPPASVSVTVSESVYWVAGGAELTSVNALALISITKDGHTFSDYTKAYDESSFTFTLTFNGTLGDGEYEVHVSGDEVANKYGTTLDEAKAAFVVAIPVVTNIAASPASLPSTGGDITATVTGVNLIGQTLQVYVNGVEAAIAAVSSSTNATAIITLPNNGTQSAKNFSITVYLNGVEVVDLASTVTVGAVAAPPTPPTVTLSSNANLAKLDIYKSDKELELLPAFTPEKTEYTVQTDAEQIELKLSPSHSKAVVKLLGERIGETKALLLAMGANVFTITVQAEDGTVKAYKLTINRIADDVSTSFCTFTDTTNHWAKANICEAVEFGIVKGTNALTFKPNGYVTRTEFAVMLLRTLQISIDNEAMAMPFSDKDSIPEWAQEEIQTAVAVGIIEGYSDGTLQPQQRVNRAEMAAMVSRAMKWEANNAKSPSFADDAAIPAWARDYVANAHENGLIKGRENNHFAPKGLTTRAEAAVVLLRLWNVLY